MENDLYQIKESAVRQLKRMHNFRRPYDEPRLRFYRQYLGQRDAQMFPDKVTPRSNTFIKYPFSNVETLVSRVHDAFFSYSPWFEVRGRGAKDAEAADAMQLVLNYMLSKSNFIQCFELLVRNILIYGHGAIKVDWDWRTDQVQYAEPIIAMDNGQPIMDPNTGEPIITGFKPSIKNVPRMCPRFYTIDIYDLLIDPDGGLSAHMCERTWRDLKQEAEARPDRYFPEGLQELADKLKDVPDADDTIIRMAELWNENSDTCTLITFGEDHDAISFKDARYAFRSASYTPYKRKVYGGDCILLWHGPNDFAHKKSPILHTSYTKIPGEIYGIGAIEIIGEQVEALNRFVNMICDNWNLGINGRYAYNTDVDIDHEALNNFNVPGGKVAVSGNPSEAIFPLPIHKPTAEDYLLLRLFREAIEMTGGISDFYSRGVGSSGGNRTATGISSIISETNYKFRMFIRNLELDILQPLLRMCASMVQQFATDEIEVQVTDAPPAISKYPRIAPEQLIGTFDFDLVAANYAANKVVRQRNFLAFANWASRTPYWDHYQGLLETAKVFEVPNATKVLRNPEIVAQEQQASSQLATQNMVLEKALDTESKALVAELAKKEPNKVTEHALQIQKLIEELLASTGMLGAPPSEPETPSQMGRPRGIQQEGPIPGVGNTSIVREFAQNMGANALGLEGLNESY